MFARVKWAQRFVIVSLCFLAGSAVRPLPPVKLRLLVEPTQRVFRHSNDVEFRVMLDNSPRPCMPLLLDAEFAAHRTGNRPLILLRFEIRDRRGREPRAVQRAIGDSSGIAPEGFKLMPCGEFFGRVASNRSDLPDDWRNEFAPGEYTVRATAEIKVRTFLRLQDEEYRQRVMAHFRIKPEHLGPMARDLMLVSEPRPFTVER